MNANDSGYFIGRADQLRALASPLRQEIVDALESAGPCSIAELATHLRRAADALYFHVRHLVRCGLVVETERQKDGRHAYSVFDVVGRPLRIDRERAAPRDLARVARGILRLAERDYERGFGAGDVVVDGPRRNHWVARAQGWLDDAGFAELNRRLESVLELLRSGRPGPGSRAVAVSFAISPPEPRREPARKAREKVRPSNAAADGSRRRASKDVKVAKDSKDTKDAKDVAPRHRRRKRGDRR